MNPRHRPSTALVTRKGTKKRVRVYRRWPFDTLAVNEEWSASLSLKEAQAARNSVYLHAKQSGKVFRTARFPISERKVELHVERIQ